MNIYESFVQFETARMLKEAGFDALCNSMYTDNGFGWSDLDKVNYNEYETSYSRPTQSLAAKWLREAHGICIILTPSSDGWIADLYDLNKWQYVMLGKDTCLPGYEAAMEDTLQEALKLIKK